MPAIMTIIVSSTIITSHRYNNTYMRKCTHKKERKKRNVIKRTLNIKHGLHKVSVDFVISIALINTFVWFWVIYC